MPKRLIVCCDGTWNDPGDHTNIAWLAENAVHDEEQKVHYDRGVGTHWYDAKTGGAFGKGLSENVREAYEFVLENYQPGDEIYCFGFSRGAFTVRSLCGFMQLVGRLASKDEIDEAYFFYRINEPDDDPSFFESLFKPEPNGKIAVKFLGVFDTVGSLGVPFEIKDDATRLEGASLLGRAGRTLLGWVDRVGDRARRPIKGFHDTSLGSITEHAYHALAIDETRAMFAPTLWTAKPDKAIRLTATGKEEEVDQHVEQAWFVGVHSDVGGGYQDEPRLADIPLLWMAEKAEATGLRFKDGAVESLRSRTNALAPQHNSMTKTWRKLHAAAKLEPIVRPMSNAQRKQQNPSGDQFPPVNTTERVYPSVMERFGKEAETIEEEGPSSTSAYEPQNLP